MPAFLEHPTVLGIGEIGLNKNTANEATVFQEHLDLAAKTDELILIHTPHLEDKYKGTTISIDVLRRYRDLEASRVMVDHAEEHTIEMILADGYWAGHRQLDHRCPSTCVRAADEQPTRGRGPMSDRRTKGGEQMELRGKKVIALGERDSVPGEAIAEVMRSAGADVIETRTECFV
jgi:hypothetical protein